VRSDVPHPEDLRALWAAADTRVFSTALRNALAATDPHVRAAAATAVARLHDSGASEVLAAALTDPDPGVRQAASLGLSALEDDAPAGIRARLLGAATTETDLPTRALLLADLGRVAGPEAEPAFADALNADAPPLREGACRAIGAMGLRGRAVDPALLERLATRVATDPAPTVRLACAWAISRQPTPPSPRAETVEALTRAVDAAAADPDSDLRLMAARIWGAHARLPVDGLFALARDSDWRVVSQAFRSSARRSDPAHDGPFARALRTLLEERLPPSAAAQGASRPLGDAAMPTPQVSMRVDHGLRVALEEATAMATGVGVAPVAEEALRRLDALGPEASRAVGLAHCLAARLVDIARGWPQRVFRCGLGGVSDAERDVHAAEVLRRVTGDPAGRAGYLLRLYERGDVRVREAVLAASAAVDDVLATRLVIRGLREADVGVVTSALDAVAARPARFLAFRDESVSARPASSDVDAVADAGPPPIVSPLPPALHGALVEAHARLATTDELEGLQSWLDVAATLGDVALLSLVHTHEEASNATLRRKARTTAQALRTRLALRGAGVESAATTSDAGTPQVSGSATPSTLSETPAPVSDALPVSAFPRADERLRAVFTLDHGEVEIALLPEQAPATVARFVQLAERGFYDGLRFHRVVPGFVVQGGDPRGDGYGGPGFSQRCEDNRVRYERGTVGMALAGRDTGGSQFFIAQAAQPHLDGRYTAFGRVVRGMEHIDEVLPDDVMRRVRIVRGAR